MKKKLLAMVLCAGMAFGLAGCDIISIDGETMGEATASIDGAIGLAVSTQNNPFFVDLANGAKSEAETKGVELMVADAGDDPAKQTSDIEDLISKGISVLIVNPVDSDAVAPAVQDAVAKGIKVIAVDRAVNGVDIDCSIASDNVAGAEMATEYLLSLVGEGADVAELQGTPGASAAIDRGQGFHNVADAKLKVVASQAADFDRAKGLETMENILQANPNIKGVFCANDEMALGALEAIGGKDIVVVGFDATDDAIAAIGEGKMAATVAQQPAVMGATAVKTAVTLAAKALPVAVTLVTE